MKYDITEEWLKERYVNQLILIGDIANEVGCTVANIRRLLKKWKLLRGKIVQQNGTVKSWNEGLTKETDKRLQSVSAKNGGENNPMFGKDSWNKGLTKKDDKRVAAISDALTGIVRSEESRAKMAKAKIGTFGAATNRWKGGKTYASGYGILRVTSGGKRNYTHTGTLRKPHSNEHYYLLSTFII